MLRTQLHAKRHPTSCMNELDLPTRRLLRRAWLAWLAFVIYGSLLPFDTRAVAWDVALARFGELPWLELGLGSRLDWLANLLLYFPLGFLGSSGAFAGPTESPAWRTRHGTAAALTLCAGLALAVALEFAQIFFAPRTVSLNDLLAEGFGLLLGSASGLLAGPRALRLLRDARAARPGRMAAWLWLYGVAYLALSFFPFDLSTATAVLAQKVERGHAGWWLAAVNAQEPLRLLLKLAGEAMLTVPFGWALAAGPARLRWPAAGLLGLVAGALVEAVQLVLLSATSQGISALSRAAGFVVGALLAGHRESLARLLTPGTVRALVIAISGAWLVVQAWIAGWGRSQVVLAGAVDRAREVELLPFYHHYFAGEARALTSVVLVLASYAWVGIACRLSRPRSRQADAALLAGILALLLESSKLLLAGQTPDPTNVLIAAVAAALAHRMLASLGGTAPGALAAEIRPVPAATPAPMSREHPGPVAASGLRAWTVLAAAAVVGATWAAPASPAGIALALAAWVACLWRQPASALFLIPVAIGLSDVATYTGPRWLETLDGAMLATALVAIAHPDAKRRRGARSPPAWAPWLLLGLLPGAWSGLGVPDLGDPNALVTPLGAGWGAMQVKGLAWAAVLAFYLLRMRIPPEAAMRLFGHGMLVALAGVVGLTVWERLAFVGPFDFTTDYRAPGPFSAIALGGAYIEAFLVAGAPFAAAAALREPRRLVRWAAGLLLLGTAYATMVTYSRAGQVVFLAAVGATWISITMGGRGTPAATTRPVSWVRGGMLVALVAGISSAVLLAPYASSRFANLQADARGRLDHWTEGLGFSRGGVGVLLFGNGAGSFGREAYLLGDPETRPGMFSLHREGETTWLRSTAGSLSYLDQRIAVSYGEPFTVSARLRTTDGRGISVLLCEKDLVQSRSCGSARLRPPADGRWHDLSAALMLPANPHAGWPKRPTRLTLFSGGRGVVDIDALSMTDAQGRQRLRNGDFRDGADHWLYSSDRHLTWHMKNLWLHVFFEYGLLGVLAQAGLLLAALLGIARAASQPPRHATSVGVALLALHGVGTIDSIIDSARFLQLYLSLVLLAWFAGRRRIA
jgi:VanZ family protein